MWDRQTIDLLCSMNAKLDALKKQIGKVVSEDAAIESEVAILVDDATKLKAAFTQLQAEVATGGAPSPQAMADLKAAVDGVTKTLPAPVASDVEDNPADADEPPL
jgi:hypothetical protein